jgi:hypothetical protein
VTSAHCARCCERELHEARVRTSENINMEDWDALVFQSNSRKIRAHHKSQAAKQIDLRMPHNVLARVNRVIK